MPTYDQLTVPEARAQLEAVVKLQRPIPDMAVEDVLVDGAEGMLPARIYRPAGSPKAVVGYLHGGGWVLGSLDAADRPCRTLAAASGCVIVSIDYRRAPETRFPGPLRDCVAAVRWLGANAERLGCAERLVLLGDSAGGNLVAAASSALRTGGPSIATQVLLYPCLAPSWTADFASYRDHADGPLMTRRELDWFWRHYLGDEGVATDPAAAPLFDTDLAGLPDTTVVVAELDPLHDEGVAYAERITTAGGTARVLEFRGAAHGFWWMDRVLAQASELTAELATLLADGPGWAGRRIY